VVSVIPNGGYKVRSEGFEMEITASNSEETEDDRLIRLCNRDIRRGVEEGRLRVETPTGCVEQTDLDGLAVHLRYPTETIWPRGSPETVRGPPLIGLEFGLSVEHEGVTNDLSSFDTDVIVYGDQHLWRLTDPWDAEVALRGMHVGEPVVYEHDHEWGTVEEIDFRD
jgi:hypothetical protein